MHKDRLSQIMMFFKDNDDDSSPQNVLFSKYEGRMMRRWPIFKILLSTTGVWVLSWSCSRFHALSLQMGFKSSSSARNNMLQHSVGFNSGKYEQIIPVVLLVLIFQSAEGRKAHKDGLSCSDYVSMAWHWLQMHICKSPVRLVICCLYQCFVPPCVWAPSSFRLSTCQRMFLSSEASFLSRSYSSCLVAVAAPSFVL